MFKKFTNGCVRVVNRWLPDAFLFAIILTLIVFVAAMCATGMGPVEVIAKWGDAKGGFWNLLAFSMQMALVLVFMVYYLIQGVVHPNWLWWLMIPVELVHLGILGMGFGIIISSMTTKYRDLTVLVDFGVSLWMYATPVVYPLSMLGEGWMRTLLQINPVTESVELMRYAILGQGTVSWGYYFLSWGVTLVIAVLGIVVFNKVERTFMDTV